MLDEGVRVVDDAGAGGLWQPVGAGVVAAMVGFISTFAVVLTGLAKVGATPGQAASGLSAICLAQAVGMLVLARRYRMPIALAWSTPGAALLAGTGLVSGGWPAAVGAFLVTGALIVLTGFWQRLGRLIAAIPAEIAQAMLAGVLLPLCLAPVHALTQSPAVVVPVILVWLVVQRYAARWAVPAAFVTAVLGAGIEMTLGHHRLDLAAMAPRVEPTLPHWSWQAMIGIAVPLYIVTMAGQNIPGTAVMESFGYRIPWRAAMATTGLGTVLIAPLGGHAINLAAVTAALTAGPSVHSDPRRRWIAVVGTGITYLVLALASGALVILVEAAPKGVLETVAGLALLATFAAALAAALGPSEHRIAGASTFLVAASGFAVFGVGAAFWGLVAGLLVRWALSARQTSDPSPVRGEGS
ncbi:benzoate/H(+) symporter BenE family transporter [Nocardia alni]|uniref:benzoate/H(+) symporter BenE family transporter n=1 Tax=Nocardia alni TaxID=2815723 RepID=UPI003F683AAE